MAPTARSHQASGSIQQLLQNYFDALNQHNYGSWTQSVTTSMAAHESSASWLQAYATTVDSSIWMQSIKDDPLQVTIHFTSQQDADLAPKNLQVPCIRWTLTYQVAQQDGGLAIGSTVPGSVSATKCS